MSELNGPATVLRDLLQQAAKRLGPLGIIRGIKLRSVEEEADLFLVDSGNLLGNSRGDAIAIPAGAEVFSDELFSKATSEWEDLNNYNHIFIDCFGKYSQGQRPVAQILLASELLEQLLGISAFLKHEVSGGDGKEIEQDFIPRNVSILSRKSAQHYVPSNGGSALTHLSDWSILPPQSVATGILILGERGAGKTWLLKAFASDQNAKFLSSPWSVPPVVFIRLQEYATNLIEKKGIEKSLAYYIASRAPGSRIGGFYMWDTLIATGHVILLFDGFDEITSEFTDDDLVEHLRWLGDSQSGRSRSVITSRGTRFSSPEKIFSLFQGDESIYRKSNSAIESMEQYIPSVTQRQYIPAYQVCLITPFSRDDIINMRMSKSARETVRAMTVATDDRRFIEEQCCTLASIPACAREIIDLIENGTTDFLRIFELGLFQQLLVSNIESGKANVDIAYASEGEDGLVEDLFGLQERTRILEHIAWFLLDTKKSVFEPGLMNFTYLEIENTQFEEVVNDLRTQTVFECNYEKGEGLRFVNQAVLAYFAARYVFSRLTDQDVLQDGLKALGRHDLASARSGSDEQMVFDFLVLFYSRGMLKVESIDGPSPTSLGENDIHEIIPGGLKHGWDLLLEEKSHFLPWLQHLPENLQGLESSFKVHPDVSASVVLKEKWAKDKVDIYLSDGVLLATPKGKAYRIAEREVTNEDFAEFLKSPWIPVLVPIEGSQQQSKVTFKKTNEFSHPFLWESVHRVTSKADKRFRYLTNDYHLFSWTKGRIPSDHDKPVCWLSAFVIAVFCNWKTWMFCDKHNLDAESHMAYQIVLDDNRYPRIYLLDGENADQPNLGYRLPLSGEWSDAARGGDIDSQYPWTQYIMSPDARLQRKGKLLREYLTQPGKLDGSVYYSVANGFGIHGMIGNVREWAYDKTTLAGGSIQSGQIMGATAQLGEETFAYDHPGSPLPMYNTNLDVGFRWARSLPKSVSEDVSNLLKGIKGGSK